MKIIAALAVLFSLLAPHAPAAGAVNKIAERVRGPELVTREPASTQPVPAADESAVEKEAATEVGGDPKAKAPEDVVAAEATSADDSAAQEVDEVAVPEEAARDFVEEDSQAGESDDDAEAEEEADDDWED